MLLPCETCQVPVSPGCPEVRGADGFLTVKTLADGSVRPVAYHWRRECSGLNAGRRRSALRLLSPAAPAPLVQQPLPQIQTAA